MACSSGTNTPISPADGLMVPMKATTATNTMCADAGKASPVAAIRPAASNSNVRRSWRGAIHPIASVKTAEPKSEAAATIPISTGP
jgi:hypothetical protein